MAQGSVFIALENVRVATPCNASWDKMKGDDQVRFCQNCARNVYNLSGMSRSEAEALIKEKEGKLCVRFYHRTDGTMLTEDCPISFRMVRKPARMLLTVIAMVLAPALTFGAVLAGGRLGASSHHQTPVERLSKLQPFKALIELFDPPEVMGFAGR